MSSPEFHLPYLRIVVDAHGGDAETTLTEAAESAGHGLALVDLLDSVTLEDALAAMGPAASSEDPSDRVAAAHSYVLAIGLAPTTDISAGLRELGVALVEPFVDEPAATAEVLASVLGDIGTGDTITEAQITMLVDEFDGALTFAGDFAAGSFSLSGPAAPLVTLLVDLSMSFGPSHAGCESRQTTEVVDGQVVPVTVVTMETCTNLPFEKARRGVDPRHWPDINPYFKSVEVLDPTTPPPPGSWAGVIQEVVGPALNLTLYRTNLTVTYVEDERLAATAYDLTPNVRTLPPDDDRVRIDRGYLSVTDEGAHRRIRVTKIFNIADLDVPHTWVCPLWVWQIVLAGWVGT